MNTKKKDTPIELARSNRIKQIRKLCGITQFFISESCEITQCTYSKMEAGNSLVSRNVEAFMDSYFREWSDREIERLESKIDYIKSFKN